MYNRTMMQLDRFPWVLITDGNIVLPDGSVLWGGTLVIHQGHIREILSQPPASLLLEEDGVSVINAKGHWVTPGLIDQHFHGAWGLDFNTASVEQMLDTLLKLARHGVTAVVPTLVSAPKTELLSALARLEALVGENSAQSVRILGLHLEGPFISPLHRGAHPAQVLLPLTRETLDGFVSPSLKRLTVAPECIFDAELLGQLTAQGVKCSVGHTGADYAGAMKAFQAGAKCMTHLFNAMAPFHHRNPTALTAGLVQDDVYVELIADGQHLSPATIQLALKAKPVDKPILISDCCPLAGLNLGEQAVFAGQTITNHPDGAINQEGHLAGGTSFLTDCVRNLVLWNILSFPQAIRLATANPAVYLEVDDTFGQLKPGALADVVLWDAQTLRVSQVLLGGQLIDQPEPIPQMESWL